jgi:hypothetical protein
MCTPLGDEGLSEKETYCDILVQCGQIKRKRLSNHHIMKDRFLRIVIVTLKSLICKGFRDGKGSKSKFYG